MSNLQKIKYLPRVLSSWEKRVILILIIIVVGAGGWLLYKLYDRHREFTPAFGSAYIEGVVGQPKYLNPLLAPVSDVDSDISNFLFSGLMKYNEKQELVPDLAESYEITPDQKNYIFHLKKGMKWHDGKELSADDVVFTVQNIKNPEYESPLMTNFKDVGIEKVDQYIVKFTLTKEVYTPFLLENTAFGILPKHLWEKIPPKSASLSELNLNPVGSGPFKFKEYQKDKKTGEILSFTLERNEEYFAKKPFLKEITFKFYKDNSLLIAALNHNEIQGIGYIPLSEKKNIKKPKKLNFYAPSLSRYYAVFFNAAKNELFEEKEIRQALALALDREKIIKEALDAQAEIVDSPILPYLFGFNPKVKKYPYDIKKARKILKKAGWKKNKKDKTLRREDEKLEIALTYPNQEEFPKVAEIIKNNWEEIGVQVKLKAEEASSLQTEIIQPRNYQALLFGQLQTHDPDPYYFWHSDQRESPGLNLTSYKNTDIDDLLTEARKTKKQEDRQKKYFHFQNILASDVPAIFLYSPKYLYGVTKKVKGIELSYLVVPSDRFANIENWYINVKRKLE